MQHNEELDETIIKKTLRSGLNCYIIPKKVYNEKRAVLSINYGSVDSGFETSEGIYSCPDGTAHFLEHKLFDNKTENAFYSFSRLGTYVNAFTSFNNTAYYFSCGDNYFKNLETLLNFITEPYFTEQTVAKEMGIIEQEIGMYDDNPGWVVYAGMLECLYKNHSAKRSIAGTKQSISNIDKDVLYKCYENFYVPSNMQLICSGNIDIDKTTEVCDKYFAKGKCRAQTVLQSEDENVNCIEGKTKMKISRPIFQIGLKDRTFTRQTKRSALYKIMLDLFIGDSSRLRERLINKGLADDSVSFDYICGNGYGYASISGESNNPGNFLEECLVEADNISKSGFMQADFERIKLKHMGRFIRGFNSIEAITFGATELALKGVTLFDFYESYKEIKIDDINLLLKECFRKGGYCIFILEPSSLT